MTAGVEAGVVVIEAGVVFSEAGVAFSDAADAADAADAGAVSSASLSFLFRGYIVQHVSAGNEFQTEKLTSGNVVPLNDTTGGGGCPVACTKYREVI